MSDHPVDAGGAIGATAPGHYGAEARAATLGELTFGTAWNVQGNGGHPPLRAEAQRLFGVALPLIPNTTARGPDWTALWLGPALLAARRRGKRRCAGRTPFAAFTAQRDALNAVDGALFDVSASRAAFRVAGPHAAAVLAKGCPLDFHPRAFPAGTCAQSMLGHVNVLIERPDASAAFVVMVARSLAQDVWRQLCLSAAQYGYDVAAPAPLR